MNTFLNRSKGIRREEQWRQVWNELEALVRGHQSSAGHRAVLHSVRECRASSDSGFIFNCVIILNRFCLIVNILQEARTATVTPA